MKFNGLWIEKTNYSGYTIHQIDYCNTIEELDIRSYSHLDDDSRKQRKHFNLFAEKYLMQLQTRVLTYRSKMHNLLKLRRSKSLNRILRC